MFTVFDLRTNKKLLITIYIRYHLLISLKKKKKVNMFIKHHLYSLDFYILSKCGITKLKIIPFVFLIKLDIEFTYLN